MHGGMLMHRPFLKIHFLNVFLKIKVCSTHKREAIEDDDQHHIQYAQLVHVHPRAAARAPRSRVRAS